MAHPFRTQTHALRQRILAALGGGSLLAVGAMGCSATTPQDSGSEDGASSGRGGSRSTVTAGTMSTAGTIATAGTTSLPPFTIAGATSMPVDAGMPVVDAGMPTTLTCPGGGQREPTCITRTAMEDLFRTGCGMIVKDPVPTEQEIADAFLPNGCLPKQAACDSCCNPAAFEGVQQADGSCCYIYCGGACCGRAFTVDGEARVAGLLQRGDWHDDALAHRTLLADLASWPEPLRDRVVREWLDDARMEHASIASFARFTLELLAFGAPSELLEAAQRATLDEVAHTRTCFALAARYEGVARGPAPLQTADASPAGSLNEAARRAFVEGCLGETLAAALARAASERSDDGDVRAALAKIADDEARHAELAWRFVAWALPLGGPVLAGELACALTEARATQSTLTREQDDSPTVARLHHAGRLTAFERQDVTAEMFAQVLAPCTDALLAAQATHGKHAFSSVAPPSGPA